MDSRTIHTCFYGQHPEKLLLPLLEKIAILRSYKPTFHDNSMHRYAVILTLALFLGTAMFADAQEKTRTAAEIQTEIDKLQIELQEAKKARQAGMVQIPLFDAPRDSIVPHSDEHILQLFESQNPTPAGIVRNVKGITQELIADYVGPQRMVPLVGLVQLRHLRWRCTVYFDEVSQNGNQIHKKDATEVLYIDQDHFYRVGEETANHLAATPVDPEDMRLESERRILQQLEQPVVLGSRSAATLDEALAMYCDQVEIPLFLDKLALYQAGIPPTNTEVTLPRGNGIKIKMKAVLDAILEQHGLTYFVKNEMLYVTSQRRAKGDLHTRVYYVGDITRDLHNDLLEIVQNVIEPESWMRMGLGGEGDVQIYPLATESFAVRQTEDVHARIEDFLTQIRRGLNTRHATVPVPVVR